MLYARAALRRVRAAVLHAHLQPARQLRVLPRAAVGVEVAAHEGERVAALEAKLGPHVYAMAKAAVIQLLLLEQALLAMS